MFERIQSYSHCVNGFLTKRFQDIETSFVTMVSTIILQSATPKLEDIQKQIFSEGAKDFLFRLHKKFHSQINQLYKDRQKRSVELLDNHTISFKNSPERLNKSWTVSTLPTRLQHRHVDLGDVSASNLAHFVSALKSDVQGIQVDFDDGHCPTWKNQLLAYNNINLLVKGNLPGAPVNMNMCPVLLLRPRAWNMIEHNILSATPKLEDIQKQIFSEGAKDFLFRLHKKFHSQINQLYKDRQKRSVELLDNHTISFKNSPERLNKSWTVSTLPTRLQHRHVDLGDVSASNLAHFVSALKSDVQGIQVDFDDGHCPTWKNQLLAYNNINLLVKGNLPGAPVNMNMCPVLLLRPRAWNMIEHNILIDGEEAIGPLVDFGILMYHNAIKLYETKSGPYFYLSKLEGSSEAELWNKIFVWTQNELGMPQGTIKACVLIENILSSFEMDEILFALREHSMGLNCGIWDYCASIVSKFGSRKEFLLPDRNKYVNMDRHFLKSYMQLVVQTCHARGAPATGGMAAAMLSPGVHDHDKESITIIDKVLAAKLKEIEVGVDGFLVYDTRIVPYVNELWKKSGATPNQIHRKLNLNITPQDLLLIPSGGVTLQGLRHNVAVSILFVFHWLAGVGHFFYSGNVEDSATAEISRTQIWQWIRFAPPLEEDPSKQVTADLVEKTAASFSAHAHKNLCRSNAERKRFNAARYMCMEIFLSRNPPEFITTYLNDNHKFRTIHNKALLSNL